MVESLEKYFTQNVEIWGKNTTQGDLGEIVEAFFKKGDVLGQLENQAGTERVTQDKETTFKRFIFYCLYPTFEIVETDEIRYGNKIFDITNAENVQDRNRIMQIDCELRS